MSARTSDHLLPPPYLGGPEVNGENCHREAIHIPGSIQPHGALLVVQARAGETEAGGKEAGDTGTAAELMVLQASENLGEFLPLQAAEALGRPLNTLLDPEICGALLRALPAGTPDLLQFRATLTASVPLALTAHRVAERLVLEIERLPGENPESGNRLRNAIFALEAAQSLTQLLETAVEAARDLSGFDRVMLYRFAEDNSGEVVAESRRPDLAPFLGHRFPESDIPAQARALYIRHLLRLTADVNAQPSALLPRVDPLTHAPTPLGGAVLRATSPMHLQYLRNMGVASSLSVSVVVEGRLWGLISCHHTAPHITPPAVRAALEELGRLLNLQVQLKQQADVAAFRTQLAAGHQQVLNTAARTLSPLHALSDPALGLRELLGADGLALRLEGEWRTLGKVPSPAALERLWQWLQTQPQILLSTDYLAEYFPEAAQWPEIASGLLAVSIGSGWQEAVIWLRAEQQQVSIWGGATPENAKTELGPRQSFATYVEQVSGHSRAWHPGEIAEAQALAQSLSATLGERLSTLRELNEELSRSNEEWRKFAFVISHDLQEPVRLIKQFMDLFSLQQGAKLDVQTKKLIEFLGSETERVRSLTSDLYAYTELLSYPELKLQTVAFSDVLAQSFSELEVLSAEKQLEWSAPEQSTLLTVDSAKLQLALTQIIRNALTFGAAPVKLHIRAEQSAEQTVLSFEDNGPGVAKEFQERVFGLFQRLGAPGSGGKSSGNGVGLTLARKVAELHGGTLIMRSVLGKGTTLILTLPQRPQAQSDQRSHL